MYDVILQEGDKLRWDQAGCSIAPESCCSGTQSRNTNLVFKVAGIYLFLGMRIQVGAKRPELIRSFQVPVWPSDTLWPTINGCIKVVALASPGPSLCR